MTNEDFKDKIDQHRRPVSLQPEERQTRSRRRSSGNNAEDTPKKKRRNMLLPVLFFIFILIPLGFLAYVQFVYDPSKGAQEEEVNSEEITYEENDNSSETNEQSADSDVPDTNSTEEKNVESNEEDAVTDPPATEEDADENLGEDADITKPATHTVESGDTLYRIAMKYYNDPAAVEKIKTVNNITNDSITKGQVLILP